MNTVVYMEKQFANIHALFNEIVGDINEQEWLSRVALGQNRLGFIIWHIPRTHDNIVQLWIRGGSEIFHRPEWAHWQDLQPFGVGTGITLDEADKIATKVHLADTLTYTEAVHQEVLTWLRGIRDADLDQAPDSAAHLTSYPEYQTHKYLDQMAPMLNQPTWNLLMRPCIGHIHRHLGELQLAKAVLRAR